MESLIFFLGRVIFGGYFVINAINHFTKTDRLVGYAESKGVRRARAAVLGAGLLILGGGLGVIFGVYVDLAALALALFLLPVSYRMHAFWRETGEARMIDQINFNKNMALLGAALMMSYISEPWPWSL